VAYRQAEVQTKCQQGAGLVARGTQAAATVSQLPSQRGSARTNLRQRCCPQRNQQVWQRAGPIGGRDATLHTAIENTGSRHWRITCRVRVAGGTTRRRPAAGRSTAGSRRPTAGRPSGADRRAGVVNDGHASSRRAARHQAHAGHGGKQALHRRGGRRDRARRRRSSRRRSRRTSRRRASSSGGRPSRGRAARGRRRRSRSRRRRATAASTTGRGTASGRRATRHLQTSRSISEELLGTSSAERLPLRL
jgi:hypothetical protein